MPTLFRSQGQDSYRSPEDLDRLVRITTPIGWLALSASLVAITVIVAWGYLGGIPVLVNGNGVLLWRQALREVRSIASGQVIEILVHEGDVVREGTVVAWLQPARSYPELSRIEIVAPAPGRVGQVALRRGAIVQVGDVVLTLMPVSGELEVLGYLPLQDAKRVHPGMSVLVSPTTVDRERYGWMPGTVRRVGGLVASAAVMKDKLGSEELARYFEAVAGGTGASRPAALVEVRVMLHEDSRTRSGYQWSSGTGPPFTLSAETMCGLQIVLDWQRPVDLVMPALKQRLGGGDS